MIIINFISNAIKFTPEGESVEVGIGYYRPDRNFVEVGVKDSGIGIDKKDMPKKRRNGAWPCNFKGDNRDARRQDMG